MRIAMIARATLYSAPGGDSTQVLKTADALRALGVAVEVHLTTDRINYNQYDLLHFFNIIRPADILRHTAKTAVPYVVSTIFVEYGHEDAGGSTRGRLRRVLGSDRVEYLKAIARRVKNGEQLGSLSYLVNGHRRSVQRVARGAALLLPNSESEYSRFVKHYGVARPHHVVPNGVDTARISKQYGLLPDYQGAVICMARFEPLKNQLRLIEALRGSGYRLFLHGVPAPNHSAYYQLCVAAAGNSDHCTIGGWLAGSGLYSAYASARVHAMPSFFETTGLSSLESAAMGCNIVAGNGGDLRDYAGDDAWYCDPLSEAAILAAVKAAYDAPYNVGLGAKIRKEYTWTRAGEETLKAYQKALGNIKK